MIRKMTMISKIKKSFLIILGSSLLVLTISIVGLSGCGIKNTPSESTSTSGAITGKDDNAENTQSTNSPESTLQTTPNAKNTEGLKNDLSSYISLMGMSRDKLADIIKETPSSIDEGGMEFKSAGIRFWFDTKSGTVNQIFTQNKSIDLNGAKIGDKIDKFKEQFGKPVSDNNGDMHFKYGDVFLSVNYDTATGTTYALYILEKDF